MVPGRRDSGYQGSEARRSSVWVRMTIVTECISVAFWVPGAIQVCGIYTPVNKINLFFFFPAHGTSCQGRALEGVGGEWTINSLNK